MDTMKLKNLTPDELDKFFAIVDKCEGRVELIVPDQIRLNLKNKLAQYFSLAKVFASNNVVPEIQISCDNPNDTMRLLRFMIAGGGLDDCIG